jgi:uncharacterized membrane protein
MSEAFPRSRASIAGIPLHPLVVPLPITCFLGALASDIAYAQSALLQWANFSAWLLAFGVFFGAIAGLLGAIDLTNREVRRLRPAWPHALGNVAALIVALFNCFVHSRDGWTSVVPTGLTLSAITVALLVVSGPLGAMLVYRHRVGVRP